MLKTSLKLEKSEDIKDLKDRIMRKVVEDFVANAKGMVTEEELKRQLEDHEDMTEEERADLLANQPPLKSELTDEMILEFFVEDMMKTSFLSRSIGTKQKGYEMLLKARFGEDFSLGGKNAKEEPEDVSPPELPFALNIKEKQSK